MASGFGNVPAAGAEQDVEATDVGCLDKTECSFSKDSKDLVETAFSNGDAFTLDIKCYYSTV